MSRPAGRRTPAERDEMSYDESRAALGPVESGERMYDHARHHHVLRGGQSRALPADLAARRLAAVEWGRQQQVETLEEGRGA
jgi:hypothetical protein